MPVPEPLSSWLVWIGVPTGKVRHAHWPALLGRFVSWMNRYVGRVQTYRSWQSRIRQARVARGKSAGSLRRAHCLENSPQPATLGFTFGPVPFSLKLARGVQVQASRDGLRTNQSWAPRPACLCRPAVCQSCYSSRAADFLCAERPSRSAAVIFGATAAADCRQGAAGAGARVGDPAHSHIAPPGLAGSAEAGRSVSAPPKPRRNTAAADE